MNTINVFVKVVVFTVDMGRLKVLLEESRLPQCEIKSQESLDTTAKKIITQYLRIIPRESYLEQLYSFSKSNSLDISIVYYLLLPHNKIGEMGKRGTWKAFEDISKNTPHYEIISYAVQRLRWKIGYTNVVYSLLPNEFTLSELQTVYESILGKTLDKRNFRKKIIALNLLQPSGKSRTGIQARPAIMYQFRIKKPTIVPVFS